MQRPMWEMLCQTANRLSLHMPAAQGQAPFGDWNPYALDTTELPMTDDLYRPTGAIAEAQRLAAESAGAAHTLMLHGGSTVGVHAMLLYAARRGETVILPRNAHLSTLNLCAVAGLKVAFAKPAYTANGRPYTTPQAYERAMERHPAAKAVVVVRPDYYGLMPDLRSIAEAAHAKGMLALCDEAHGAYFNWRAEAPNAGECGADLFVQSAHKTLPALTAGAWLHAAPGVDIERLRRMLRMVQTSSPSFLTMLSLDDARAWMAVHGAGACRELGESLTTFRKAAAGLGYENSQDDSPEGMAYDPLRLALRATEGGFALEAALRRQGIDVEMADETGIVAILSLLDGPKRLQSLEKALEGTARERTQAPAPKRLRWPEQLPERAMPLGEAVFAESVALPMEKAVGRISAAQVGLYPPGVALLVAGEVISAPMVEWIKQWDASRVFGLPGAGEFLCVGLE